MRAGQGYIKDFPQSLGTSSATGVDATMNTQWALLIIVELHAAHALSPGSGGGHRGNLNPHKPAEAQISHPY